MHDITARIICDYSILDRESRRCAHNRFALIAGILPFVGDKARRCSMISEISASESISRQTIRRYLWLYLVNQDITILAPKAKKWNRALTQNEKNMRWALNKFIIRETKTA